ncbi:MAG: 4-hydroxybenzoate octaprenyltransferase [Nitrospinae bacterium CG11_big_fil_rev_8_21_14_0_20_56_8]|nr:MAG: 4-hydroxybenzoate octaprenyltransferase [Nitrospinae bacterium CG11_big_fil_rev_8_21_14_0_20_56_8]
MTPFEKLAVIFQDIKIQHTVFALPFAVISAFLAAGGLPPWDKLFWIVVAMFGGRSAAMAFNRIVDARYDATNPRTRDRALPAQRISAGPYAVFLVASSLLLVWASYMLNPLAFYLSPVALAIVFFYSLTKRFTPYSHLFLGFAIAVAPVGAWVAIREEISLVSLVLGAAVVFWLAGFDVIYSCLDVEHDAQNRLHSIPRRFGLKTALWLAAAAHVAMVVILLSLGWLTDLGPLYLFGVTCVAGMLGYEHSLVHPGDLSKVNFAFFNVNGAISLVFMTLVIADCVWI